jgi:hypothetical protein
LSKKKALFPTLIRPSATFSQHKLGEGRDEGGRLSRYYFFIFNIGVESHGMDLMKIGFLRVFVVN